MQNCLIIEHCRFVECSFAWGYFLDFFAITPMSFYKCLVQNWISIFAHIIANDFFWYRMIMYLYFVAIRSRRIWFTNIVVCQIGEHVIGLYKSMTFILDIKGHKRIRKNSDSISSNLFQIGFINLLLFDMAEHCLNSNLSWHIGLIRMTLICWCLTGKYVIIH